MSKIDEVFEYKMGEIIKYVSPLKGTTFLKVVGRELDECPGGVQYHYVCRPLHENGIAIQKIKVNSMEVTWCDLDAELKKIAEEQDKEDREAHEKAIEMRAEVRARMEKLKEDRDAETDET